MRRRIRVLICAIAILAVVQSASLASAVSGSDTPAYAYDNEGVWGIGEHYAIGDKVTGDCKAYVFIYVGLNDAWAAVYASYSGSGSYRWKVTVNLKLTAYANNVGWASGSDIYIRIELLDARLSRIAIADIWHGDYGAEDRGDKSFSAQDFIFYFGTPYSNVKYFGVVLHTYAGNGGMICRDSQHTSIDYPAVLEVNSIAWQSY